jgi:glutamine cyclotransferase
MHDDLKIILLPLLIVFSLSFPPSMQPVLAGELTGTQAKKTITPDRPYVPVYHYRIVNIYPHDPGAFTQGLIYHDGVLYEGTGLHGASSLRKVDLETGRILKIHHLPGKYFGEGIALCGNRLIQLTYQSNVGFIYDLDLQPAGSFHYPTEGWGLACDGDHLILSDGTATLRRLDLKTYRIIKELTVTDRGRPVRHLNELEMVKGEIYANIWQTEKIARISPATGEVTGWIDLGGLSALAQAASARKSITGTGTNPDPAPLHEIDVLNGIAYDKRGDRLFVTGKFWPKLFEIKLEK